MTSEKNKYTRYWLQGDINENASSLLENDVDSQNSHSNLIRLSSIRNAISNFVYILTNKNIPVEFLQDDESYTDGKCVYISSLIHDGNFDSTVGISLHEASHILLTNFNLLESIKYSISDKLTKKARAKNFDDELTISAMHNFLNWIEDRRIDNFIFNTSPGYRGYYMAMYNRYFFDKIISDGLQSSALRDETYQSYKYRVINILNEKSDLDALAGLREIYNIIDIKNINRLKSTSDSLEIAEKILHVVLDNINPIDVKDEKRIDALGKKSKSGNRKKGKSDSQIEAELGEKGKKKKKSLTKKELDDLIDAIIEQSSFLIGGINKKPVSKKEGEILQSLSDVDTTIETIKVKNMSVYDGNVYDVVVMKKVTESMFNSGIFPFSDVVFRGLGHVPYIKNYTNAVNDGIVLGRQLGERLLIRNEQKVTEYNRKKSGFIDRRLLYEFGIGNESIFKHTTVEYYPDAMLHISIDVSSSMRKDKKLENAIKITTAICQAASMMQGNLNIVVSVRGTLYNTDKNDPVLAIIYDSKVDKMNKIRTLFPRLQAVGTTPEGLCFAAMNNLISESTTKLDSYFLNISDGDPFYYKYSGEAAALHTRGEVRKMRQKGVKILSYYVGKADSQNDFMTMYESSAQFIEPSSIMDIAKTLNNLFLEKH